MSDFQPPVYNDEEPARPHEFDDFHSLQELVNSFDPKRREFIEKLPTLSEDDLKRLNQADSFCPICYNTFGAIIADAEMASALDTPAVATQHLGVTRLAETCGHVFCRKDITTWIERNDRCPTCRTPFYESPRETDEDAEHAFPNLQSFTLGDLMPSVNDLQWGGMFGARAATTTQPAPAAAAAQTTSEGVAPANATADTDSAAQPSSTNETPTSTSDSASSNSSANSNGTANNRDNTNPQRAENDAQIERMLERMRGLGQGAAMNDIMFGLAATMGRGGRQSARRQEPDDDRNEYAGLYS